MYEWSLWKRMNDGCGCERGVCEWGQNGADITTFSHMKMSSALGSLRISD